MGQCEGCQKLKRNGECAVFKPKPGKCWAWTDDPLWGEKVKAAVKAYRMAYMPKGDDEDDEA